MYVEAIKENGLNISDYEDILSEITDKRMCTIAISPINNEMAVRIMTNIDNTIKDMLNKDYVLEKCTFQCKYCDFLQYCKYNKPIN